MTLKPLGITYVVYEEGSKISKILALLTLSPQFAVCALTAAVVVTRCVSWFWALLGAVTVDIFCTVVKVIVKQPRPAGSYKDGYGMPSEHAAFCVFLALHFSLVILLRLRCAFSLKALAWLILWVWAILVCYSRLHLGVHTDGQILVGAAIGIGGALVWLAIEKVLEKPLYVLQEKVDGFWAWLDIHWIDTKRTD
eukprot:gnl/MRDRNA2_/MRDRNA2_166448_c0_seq1.p1 gnl/MRDRNA2_/MRDRNA2_166448_c0~~gnl/MRDRNA2_/MRDRNA2_166448_c0_seq1.p1  ORF type:complete len:195 (-),score=19.48 gnl/MRDRNA2_/MRDRNA2_166448_c0_seq1:31-615(-)